MRSLLSFTLSWVFLTILATPLEAGSIDSLKKAARTQASDTARFEALYRICDHYWTGSVDSAFKYAKRTHELGRRIGKPYYIGRGLNNMGIANILRGDLDTAIGYCHRADSVAKRIGDRKERLHLRAGSLSNLGLIYRNAGKLDSCKKYFLRALEVAEEHGDSTLIARQELNLGTVYKAKANYPRAKELFLSSSQKAKALEKPEFEAKANTNLGVVLHETEEYEEAVKRYGRSIEIFERIDKKRALGEVYINRGLSYLKMKRYEQAKDNYRKGLSIFKAIEAPRGQVTLSNNFGELYVELFETHKDSLPAWVKELFPSSVEGVPSLLLDSASHYYKGSLAMGKEYGLIRERSYAHYGLGQIRLLRGDTARAFSHFQKSLEEVEGMGMDRHEFDLHQRLAEFHEWKGNYQKAYQHHEEFARLRDSVFNEKKSKELGRLQAEHEYEKKRAMERAKSKAEQRRQRIIIYSMGGGLFLMLLFSGVLVDRYRVIRGQKRTIEDKKQEVDEAYQGLKERDREISYSLDYAQSIQQAILPGRKRFEGSIPGESVLFFQPKEKVSGDFYWCNRAPDGAFVWVAADCTGHGVPGAFMSMIGIRLLNEAVLEKGLSDPGKILDHVREGIEAALGGEEDEEGKSDGMDAVACSYSEADGTLAFAGANNPLYLIRKGSEDSGLPEPDRSLDEGDLRLYEYKGDKMAVGPGPEKDPFRTRRIKVMEGDMAYCFSDGFADQFGGEKGKKFRYGPFKRLLCRLHSQPVQDQEEGLQRTFAEWRQGLEQVDDVCVLGVRFPSS